MVMFGEFHAELAALKALGGRAGFKIVVGLVF